MVTIGTEIYKVDLLPYELSVLKLSQGSKLTKKLELELKYSSSCYKVYDYIRKESLAILQKGIKPESLLINFEDFKNVLAIEISLNKKIDLNNIKILKQLEITHIIITDIEKPILFSSLYNQIVDKILK